MFDRRRPDPALGVFETLLVLDGRPVELEAHVARLEASLAKLFPGRPIPSLSADVDGAGMLRIAVAPDGGGLTAQIERRDARPGGVVSLHSLTLAGGLGAHKWADRSLLDGVGARLPAEALPLIVDRDSAVLEASRANVFAVRDGALLTPPLDGRILPGVTRMRVIELAAAMEIDVSESNLSHDDLLSADEVFLTGSVRGVEPVQALDGVPLPNGEVTARIAAELRRAWAGAEFG